MRYLLLLITVPLLVNCASEQELQLAYMAQVEVVQAQTAIQDKDTITVDCSKGGCGGAVIHYLDPRDRNRISVPIVKGTNNVIIETLPSVTNMFTWAVGAFAVTEIIDDITHNAGSNNRSTTTNVAGQNNTVDNSFSADVSGDSSTDSSNHNNPVDNSAVSTPTVVEQPAPVIVDPLIVEQETIQVVDPVIVDPVIVEQETIQVVDPVIVDPIIVEQETVQVVDPVIIAP